jgi:hypothetical protein
MKLILDCNPADMGTAMNLVFQVMRSNPQQKIGRGSAVRENIGGKVFEVIRNQDSYTVKASGK